MNDAANIDWRFATPSIHARLIERQDADLYAALYSNPSVMANIGATLDSEGICSLFEKVLVWNTESPMRARYWHLAESATGRAVGIQSALKGSSRQDEVELGLMILPGWQGQGIGFEVTTGILDALFGDRWPIDASAAFASHLPENFRIGRLGLSLGFEPHHVGRSGLSGWKMTRERWLTRPGYFRRTDIPSDFTQEQ